MKMKKIASLVLVLALLSSLGVPAFASVSDLNQRMETVTLKVKETLGIGDDYTDFSGDLTDSEPTAQWNLYWSKENESLQVRATQAGKVISYYCYSNEEPQPRNEGSIPKFPTLSSKQSKEIAYAFLDKVLDKGIESVELSDHGDFLTRYNNESYYFYGNLKLFGIDTPIYVSLAVSADTKNVTSFSRNDSGQDYSTVTKPGKAVPIAAASKTLFDTVKMQLTYALRYDNDGSTDKTAHLQYAPVHKANYVVDAATGQLIDITAEYNYMYFKTEGSANAADQGARRTGLTDVETKAVTELRDVLPQSTLESKARSISELGISGAYSLDSVSYYTYTDEEKPTQVIANLYFTNKNDSYVKDTSEDAAVNSIMPPYYRVSYKNIVLDAKQGTLISFSSSRYSSGTEDPVINYSRVQLQATAQSFANKFEPDKLAVSVLAENDSDPKSEDQSFIFNHTVNGIAFPQNAIYVSVDANTGNISSYSVSWVNDITFVSADSLLTVETVSKKYADAVGAVLAYVFVPINTEKTDYYYQETELKLAYIFNPDSTLWGIDAVSGELLKYESERLDTITYDDISTHYAANMILALAEYGVGYSGGSFQPNKQLTQKDLVALLVSAGGYQFMPLVDEKAEEDNLYQRAYAMGILTKDERSPSKLITRAELAKMMVNAVGYGKLGKISDIYVVKFKDAGAVPSALYGYVAIAKGLGIISGDPGGNFHPNNIATRSDAAVILFKYMSK